MAENTKSVTGEAMDELGKRLQRLGCALTLLLTLPILGLVFFGIIGLIVGGAIGLLFGIGMLAPEKPKA